jgi:disulfide oxidoreductase YuzD
VEDAERQMRTAAEILQRFDHHPGVILADEVGMGKTFVALAVAASVVEATKFKYPVVVMVPTGVKEKWPREWDVFRRMCLTGDGREIRATNHTINKPSDFLKLLDDPRDRRRHIIFLTHGALTNSLTDPFVRLAVLRRAMYKRSSLAAQRRSFPRWAGKLLRYPPFRNADFVEALLSSKPAQWREICAQFTENDPEDDPVPHLILKVLDRVDLRRLVEALRQVPRFTSKNIEQRLKAVRAELAEELKYVWKECMSGVSLRLPLLVLDEAHHAKNPWTRLAGLFADRDAQRDAGTIQGTFAGAFDRMLFMTATPFQLGHDELLSVLRHFESIRWTQHENRQAFVEGAARLKRALDAAQTSALRLETAWSRLTPADLGGLDEAWWQRPDDDTLPERARAAAARAAEVSKHMREAETLLRPWVIRHTRHDRDKRRTYRPGGAIIEEGDGRSGLRVSGSAVLPFLLASRAQALVAAESLYGDEEARAYFAEGLASSFEAYRETRSRASSDDDPVDEDGADARVAPLNGEIVWYLNNIDKALPTGNDTVWAEHPKVKATIERALSLWRDGEKVVVFCFFIATGRALRNHISSRIKRELIEQGAKRLSLAQDDEEAVLQALELFGVRFFDPEAPVTRFAESFLDGEFRDFSLSEDERRRAKEVVIRFLRTPSFLVRYVDISNENREAALQEALLTPDVSGLGLRDKIRSLGQFLQERVPEEREELLGALEGIRTGSSLTGPGSGFEPGERASRRDVWLPNVRLANGQVPSQARRRLMLAFNTPFFPEVLVASAVMAEGVDLHLNCRFVIHHDLDWNPSVLEQRTGRVDRLGSKAERCEHPIVVYEPYIEATQDEKQFRVVKDRERWFNVVMGERLQLAEAHLDTLAERPDLPAELARRLSLSLSVV